MEEAEGSESSSDGSGHHLSSVDYGATGTASDDGDLPLLALAKRRCVHYQRRWSEFRGRLSYAYFNCEPEAGRGLVACLGEPWPHPNCAAGMVLLLHAASCQLPAASMLFHLAADAPLPGAWAQGGMTLPVTSSSSWG